MGMYEIYLVLGSNDANNNPEVIGVSWADNSSGITVDNEGIRQANLSQYIQNYDGAKRYSWDGTKIVDYVW